MEYLGLYTVNISLWIATADWSAVITLLKERYLVVFMAATILPRQRKSTSVSKSWLLPQLDSDSSIPERGMTLPPIASKQRLLSEQPLYYIYRKYLQGNSLNYDDLRLDCSRQWCLFADIFSIKVLWARNFET